MEKNPDFITFSYNFPTKYGYCIQKNDSIKRREEYFWWYIINTVTKALGLHVNHFKTEINQNCVDKP